MVNRTTNVLFTLILHLYLYLFIRITKTKFMITNITVYICTMFTKLIIATVALH